MAKNKVKIDIDVDDNGTTKKVGLDAKKTGKGLDGVANSSRNAQKGIKGVAQTASAGGKNFAGMSRGMGGLVGAYAAFAAQLFAISAAFEFFKRAGNLEVLKAGQQAYAGATGIAMRTLAKDIQAATDAQITFRDASQAAAIGIASGLSPEQLTRLGTAAKDAAAILGRDVTDAFNRLVKGVTKAEPELLDELGIILRLETANENYATSLGILAKDLTQFQKSQAVANEVLNQSESKYSAILAAVGGGSVNQFNKLGKSMDDIVMKIQTFLLPLANAFADVFISLPLVGLAAFGLLLKGPLNAMGLSMVGMRDSARAAAVAHKAEYDSIKVGAVEAGRAVEVLTAKMNKKGAGLADKKGLATVSPTVQALKDKGGYGGLNKREQMRVQQALKAIEGKYKQHEIITKGIFKGLKYSMVSDMVGGLQQIEAATIKLAATSKGVLHTLQVGWAMAKSAVVSFGAAVVSAGQFMMKWLGIIGLVATAVQMLYSLFSTPIEKTSAEIMLERTREKVKALNEEYADMLALQDILTKKGEGGEGLGAAIGNRVGGISHEQQIITLQEYIKFQQRSAKTGYEAHAARLKQMKEERGFFNNYIGGMFRILTGNGYNIYQAQVEVSTRKESGWLSFFRNEADLVSDAGESAKTYFEGQNKIIELFMGTQKGGSKALTNYYNQIATIIKDSAGRDMNKKEIEQMNLAKDGVEGVGKAYSDMAKLKTAASDSANKFFIGLAPLNAAQSSIVKYRTELANLQTVIKDAQNTSEDDAIRKKATDRQEVIKKEIKLLRQLDEADHLRKMGDMKVKRIQAEAGATQDKLYKTLFVAQGKLLEGDKKSNDLLEKKQELEIAVRREMKENYTDDPTKWTEPQRQKNAMLNEEIRLQNTLNDIVKDNLDKIEGELPIRREIAKIKFNQQILTYQQNELKHAQLMTKELTLQLKLATDKFNAEEAVRKREDVRENPFSFLDADKRTNDSNIAHLKGQQAEQTRIIELERKNAQAMLQVEHYLLAEKWRMEKSKMDLAIFDQQLIADEARNIADKFRLQNGFKDPEAEANATEQAGRIVPIQQAAENVAAILARLPEITRIAGQNINQTASSKTSGLDAAIDKLEHANYLLSDMGILTDGLANSLATNMASAFEGIINGTMSVKNAFATMAMGILNHLSKMIAELLAAKLIMMMMGMINPSAGAVIPQGNPLSGTVNLQGKIGTGTGAGVGWDDPTGRYGGVFSQGKKMQGYATGGVARGSTSGYPATLHGTEAVVPLPTGRSIPVEMKDSGATNNNIVVNISSEGQSNKEGSTGPDMDKMGAAVAKAVQVELQNQKRSGGILNPYGVA